MPGQRLVVRGDVKQECTLFLGFFNVCNINWLDIANIEIFSNIPASIILFFSISLRYLPKTIEISRKRELYFDVIYT